MPTLMRPSPFDVSRMISELQPKDLRTEQPVLKFTSAGGRWFLEVEDIDWVGGSHGPEAIWRAWVSWDGAPSSDALHAAISDAYSSPKNFVVCRFCQELGGKARVHRGHAFSDDCCHACASEQFGVLF